jgi:GNAT superfamily N-acetyltransferase
MKYQIEKFSDMMNEGKPLFRKHWEEIARNKEIVPLDPDWEKYLRMEDAGFLHVATVRDGGKLIGYCIDIVSSHLHYRHDLFSINDVIYVEPDYRGKGVGVRLIKFSLAGLMQIGVSVAHMHMKLDHDFGALMERLGYHEIERIYEKVLKT